MQILRIGFGVNATRVLACLCLSSAAFAEQNPTSNVASSINTSSGTNYRIAMVLSRAEGPIETAFKDYLTKSGVRAEYVSLRYSGKIQDAPALIAMIRSTKPDLIYTWGTSTTLAIAGAHNTETPEQYIRDIPLIFTEVTDPISSKLLPALDRPGRNVTGVSHVADIKVQLNSMKAYRNFKRIGYIDNPKEPNSQIVRKKLGEQSKEYGFEIIDEIVPLDANGQPDATALPALIQRIALKRPDFLYVGPITFLAFTHRDLVTQSALENNLPTFCATESIVRKAKCLVGLFSSEPNVGRFAAFKATQILRDRKSPFDIPAETLQKFSLLINMPVARALDLYPPLGLLNVSDVVSDAQVANNLPLPSGAAVTKPSLGTVTTIAPPSLPASSVNPNKSTMTAPTPASVVTGASTALPVKPRSPTDAKK